MKDNLFRGELVRLASDDPATVAEVWSRWGRNSEYMLLLDTDPPVLWSKKKIQEWIEKNVDKEEQSNFFFTLRTLEDDRVIGFISLFELLWNHGDPWVAIGLGEPEYWGKGYGSDAMRLIQRYAFTELNLHRITLCVFEYNPRAIRSYEKVGFVEEGRVRGEFLRQGRRWDVIFMGVLRQDWERLNGEAVR